ncbi:MAG: hypothetical protein PHY59_08940 [Methanobacterium sp.]|nr:hypothetical protein [Methanobacterium sp.]
MGNIYLNPSGAIFFNLGCILSGMLLIPFFAGLYNWKPIKKLDKILLILGIVIGIYASVSLIMVGVFPETHLLSAGGVFGSLFIIIIFLSIALFRHPKFIHLIAYYGIITVIIDISFQIICNGKKLLSSFNQTVPIPGLEWTVCFASMAWVGFLALNMLIKKV